MGELIYSTITSLDGFIADEQGNFDWAEPDDEVHGFVNDQERPIGTYLYGRRLYETMAVWDDDDWLAGEPAVVTDYAQLWRAADKIVYSTTLDEVSTKRTRLERTFDADAVPPARCRCNDRRRDRRRQPRRARCPRRAGRRVPGAGQPGDRRRRHAVVAPAAHASTSSWSTSAASPTASSTCATAPGDWIVDRFGGLSPPVSPARPHRHRERRVHQHAVDLHVVAVAQLVQGERRLHRLHPTLRVLRRVDRLLGELQGEQRLLGDLARPGPW